VETNVTSVQPNATPKAFSVEAGKGRPVHVLGNDVIVKISSRDTGGAFTVFEGRTRPLAGPPLHLHCNQDEWWYILAGEFKFEVDGQETYAGPGATVFAPRGSRHTFQNVGTVPGRMLTTVVPGGVDLFFEELETVAPRGTIPDRAAILAVFAKHDQELLGPPPAQRTATKPAGNNAGLFAARV
jgi:mannose-6-phosphate isomerase-like protein (cupin superfamily)